MNQDINIYSSMDDRSSSNTEYYSAATNVEKVYGYENAFMLIKAVNCE